MITIGGKPDGSRGDRSSGPQPGSRPKPFAIVEVKGATVVSSGDYERYMVDVYKGRGEVSSYLDPRTGYPAKATYGFNDYIRILHGC